MTSDSGKALLAGRPKQVCAHLLRLLVNRTMLDQVPGEFVASLLAELGVKAAKGVLGYFGTRDATSTKSRKNTPDLTAEEVGVEPAEYSGETQQFLARQRLHHRIDLAKAKWAWLVAATYYHPTRGRTQDIALEWHPRKIAGQFTVSDFASRDLPHESYIGESAPSDVRLSIIQGRITIAAALRDTLGEIEGALAQ